MKHEKVVCVSLPVSALMLHKAPVTLHARYELTRTPLAASSCKNCHPLLKCIDWRTPPADENCFLSQCHVKRRKCTHPARSTALSSRWCRLEMPSPCGSHTRTCRAAAHSVKSSKYLHTASLYNFC